MSDGSAQRLGIAGRIARYFQAARITPLLALVALLLGVFALSVTPREEEPQIDVTMANVLIPFPGASAHQVEQAVAGPAEQVLSQMAGIEHVMSVSRPGLAVLTVQFKVGLPRTEALVRLHDTLQSHRDWLPAGLPVGQPLIKPKGIDDVPILTLTLYDRRPEYGSHELRRIAESLEAELKRVPGTREVSTVGGPRHAVNITLNPEALRNAGLSVGDVRGALQLANTASQAGTVVNGNAALSVDAGEFLPDAASVADLIVTVRGGRPVYLRDVASVSDGPLQPDNYVWFGQRTDPGVDYPAVTLAVTKKPGQNAASVTRALRERIAALQNTLIPDGVGVEITRDYGSTANEKALKLIEKLLFATSCVIALVWLTMGRREAAIVGIAVALTLTVTLFASWAWGFTLNRVSLFALIFSIGILVDDAIVVVESIHRRLAGRTGQRAADIIPAAVDEVGNPTILATLTVIAALLPMAFVSGLMGPYMAPIPINASMGMLISLAIAFILTPWLAHRWLARDSAHSEAAAEPDWITTWVRKLYPPFLDAQHGQRRRRILWLAVLAMIVVSLLLPAVQWVALKMLPFDNKSELQLVLDMPEGTALEKTNATLAEMTRYLATVPEVRSYQVYAGLSAPINFNGLVRQYYLRNSPSLGDIQVNLVERSDRKAKSHEIAERIRPPLAAIASAAGGALKVVEVPPGPPVQAPIVAEIYGPDDAGRLQLARSVRQTLASGQHIVDVDASYVAEAPRKVLAIDRARAALAGVSQAEAVQTLRIGLSGDDAGFLNDGSKYPTPLRIQLSPSAQGNLDELNALPVRSATGSVIPVGSLLSPLDAQVEQPLFHKDLLPVTYVTGDMAGGADSPLYGMFGLRKSITALKAPDGGRVSELFISQPEDAYRGYALKWDGEWQITYETFRDMGAAYAVGLVLIYLLIVAEFGSYLLPLIIMAPIPLTIVGVMPGHSLLRAPFTATSMIGMIALAGIIVRNSILLVDAIRLQTAAGVALTEAIINSVAARARPIALTALAAMLGALFILDDPIFNGLAISLIFGILVSTLLTLIVIPLLYFVAYRTSTPVLSIPTDLGSNPSEAT